LGIGDVLRAAELFPVLLHHRAQHRLAGVEAESKERRARVLEHLEQWQRHLHRGHGWRRMHFPGERSCATSLHGGSLPFGLSNHPPYGTAEGAAALLSGRQFNRRRDIPLERRRRDRRQIMTRNLRDGCLQLLISSSLLMNLGYAAAQTPQGQMATGKPPYNI